MVKGAQSDPNYVSRLLLDCVPAFHKIIIPAYLLYRSGPVAIYYSEIYSLFYGFSHTVMSSLLQMFAGGPKITVTPLDRTSHPIIIIIISSSSNTQEKKKKRKLQVTINKNYNVHT